MALCSEERFKVTFYNSLALCSEERFKVTFYNSLLVFAVFHLRLVLMFSYFFFFETLRLCYLDTG